MSEPTPNLQISEQDIFDYICSHCESKDCNEDNADECTLVLEIATIVENNL